MSRETERETKRERPKPIQIVARVTESKELMRGLIYDTHLEFMSIDENHKNLVAKTIEHILKKT